MNTLSWLLYGAEVSDSLKGVLLFGGSMIAIIGTIGGLMAATLGAESWSYDNEDVRARKRALPGKVWKVLPRLWGIYAVAVLIGVALPSKTTLMLIAASQAGESILATDQAKQVGGEAGAMLSDSMKLLHQYITDQLGKSTTQPSK